jgi:hypothetical protein
MVHRGHAYVGHMFSKGFSVIDVTDPGRPRAVNYLAAPPVIAMADQAHIARVIRARQIAVHRAAARKLGTAIQSMKAR